LFQINGPAVEDTIVFIRKHENGASKSKKTCLATHPDENMQRQGSKHFGIKAVFCVTTMALNFRVTKPTKHNLKQVPDDIRTGTFGTHNLVEKPDLRINQLLDFIFFAAPMRGPMRQEKTQSGRRRMKKTWKKYGFVFLPIIFSPFTRLKQIHGFMWNVGSENVNAKICTTEWTFLSVQVDSFVVEIFVPRIRTELKAGKPCNCPNAEQLSRSRWIQISVGADAVPRTAGAAV